MQQTLKSDIAMTGVGLHSGKDITLTLRPADEDSGITFIRTDITDKNNKIPAHWDSVVNTQLCTVIGNEDAITVGTVEHLMSALRGCGVDNVTIELDGAEVPVMDGSAIEFVKKIEETGTQEQGAKRKSIKVLKEIRVENEDKHVTLTPSESATFGGEIVFDHPKIGAQRFETTLANDNFKNDIAEARTFGFLHEVEWMRSQGLALGGSLDNAIVLDKENGTIMNEEGLRFENEFIRHKLLDAIGDLYLAGHQIIGNYDSMKAGHAINNDVLHALFADDSNYEIVES